MRLVFVGFNGLTPHFVDDYRILLGCVWTFAELCWDCLGFLLDFYWDFFGIWMLFQLIDSIVWDSCANLNSSRGIYRYPL